ncbi:surfeit locus protein 6 homolog [Microplitis mediator]|uniref:surfeit locus protein 6 homolog n=1 Tax=Microplitis mediator TaxID=375433 RepID=UPI0025570DF1|nr:surfeit locus protein 6 homolog [Microplitis mediator]
MKVKGNKKENKKIELSIKEEEDFIQNIFDKMPIAPCKLETNIKKENGQKKSQSRVKPVFNSEGHMIFSKFDFSEIGTKKQPKKSMGSKDPKKRLEELKNKKLKLKQLKAEGNTKKAKLLEQKESWRAILAKASGQKILDDPELLKQSIKRKEKQKAYSAKKWEARLNKVQKDKEDRQKKRQENILKRKKDKKTNKLKRASKKGRIIPGY